METLRGPGAVTDRLALVVAIAYAASPHLIAQAYNGITETLFAAGLPFSTYPTTQKINSGYIAILIYGYGSCIRPTGKGIYNGSRARIVCFWIRMRIPPGKDVERI